jgi:hypothetical protein
LLRVIWGNQPSIRTGGRVQQANDHAPYPRGQPEKASSHHVRTVLARYTQQISARPAAWLRAPKPGRDPRHQIIEPVRPPSKILYSHESRSLHRTRSCPVTGGYALVGASRAARTAACVNRWLSWRRRHQYRARISHYQRRLHERQVRLEYCCCAVGPARLPALTTQHDVRGRCPPVL